MLVHYKLLIRVWEAATASLERYVPSHHFYVMSQKDIPSHAKKREQKCSQMSSASSFFSTKAFTLKWFYFLEHFHLNSKTARWASSMWCKWTIPCMSHWNWFIWSLSSLAMMMSTAYSGFSLSFKYLNEILEFQVCQILGMMYLEIILTTENSVLLFPYCICRTGAEMEFLP